MYLQFVSGAERLQFLTDLLSKIDPPQDKRGQKWFAHLKTLLLWELGSNQSVKSVTDDQEKLVIAFQGGETLEALWVRVVWLWQISQQAAGSR